MSQSNKNLSDQMNADQRSHKASCLSTIADVSQKFCGDHNQNLSDQLLTDKLGNLTLTERRLTLELLLSLAEFDNRKLFAATHSSLFSYAT
jgi:hypothetical protein